MLSRLVSLTGYSWLSLSLPAADPGIFSSEEFGFLEWDWTNTRENVRKCVNEVERSVNMKTTLHSLPSISRMVEMLAWKILFVLRRRSIKFLGFLLAWNPDIYEQKRALKFGWTNSMQNARTIRTFSPQRRDMELRPSFVHYKQLYWGVTVH